MTTKILALITSCKGCTHHRYESGGIYICGVVNQPVFDSRIIAPFCPLPDHPASIIAAMDMTIRRLRKEHPWNTLFPVLDYIATRLGTNLTPQGHISIKLEDGGQVTFMLESLGEVTDRMSTFHFFGEEGEYKLRLLHDRTELFKKVMLSIEGHESEHWQVMNLA